MIAERDQSMIAKSGNRVSEKIVLHRNI
jgi:hypothetical protein